MTQPETQPTPVPGKPVLRSPTEIQGVPVPLNHVGLPDPNTILGIAASLLARADHEDAEARSWQDASNATGNVTLSTSTLRRLVDAAVRSAIADGRPVLDSREPGALDPIHLDPGDRVRFIVEGTVEQIREGMIGGGYPTIVTDHGRRYESDYPLLTSARIERLAPTTEQD